MKNTYVVKKTELNIILPVYNEGPIIGKVIKEFYEELRNKVKFSFIICEDGSTDSTKEVLKQLSKKYPLKLIFSKKRKGYSKAVIDGYRQSTADYILAVDSDGQCDPKDFYSLWKKRRVANIVIGWRINRQDHLQRKLLSMIYKNLHKILFKTPIHDPSCPFVLIKRETLLQLLDKLGTLEQGFWWEFTARALQQNTKIIEVPVNHRQRLDGKTRVYTLTNLPKIAFTHLVGLIKIYREGKINNSYV